MNSTTALDIGVPRRKLNVHDYHRMGEAGILAPGDRVELIDGEIIQITPVGDLHVDLVIVLTAHLSIAVANQAFVSVQNPLRLDDHTEPEPDLALLRLDRRRSDPLAGNALLFICWRTIALLKLSDEANIVVETNWQLPSTSTSGNTMRHEQHRALTPATTQHNPAHRPA